MSIPFLIHFWRWRKQWLFACIHIAIVNSVTVILLLVVNLVGLLFYVVGAAKYPITIVIMLWGLLGIFIIAIVVGLLYKFCYKETSDLLLVA
jgi:O-antigen ligase